MKNQTKKIFCTFIVNFLLFANAHLFATTSSKNTSTTNFFASTQSSCTHLFPYTKLSDTQSHDTKSSSKESSPVVGSPFSRPRSAKDFFSQTDLFFSFSPAMLFNTEKNPYGNNIFVVFPLAIGFTWPNYTLVSFSPYLSFFLHYTLWNEEQQIAFITTSENRTTTTLAFMLTLPALFSFRVNDTHIFQLGAGLSLLMRVSFLSKNINEDDIGTSGSAKSDAQSILKWQWEKARWLYFSLEFSYLYKISSSLQIGPSIQLHIPSSTIFLKSGKDAIIFSAGIKISL